MSRPKIEFTKYYGYFTSLTKEQLEQFKTIPDNLDSKELSEAITKIDSLVGKYNTVVLYSNKAVRYKLSSNNANSWKNFIPISKEECELLEKFVTVKYETYQDVLQMDKLLARSKRFM